MWASSVLCCLKHVSLSVGNTVQASRQLPGGESSPSRPVTLAKGPPCSDTSSSSLMTPAGVWGLGCEPVLLGTPLLLSHSSVSDSVIPRPVARQAPLSTGFSREGCCGGLPCPPPGDLPNPGIEPASPVSLTLAGGFFPTEPLESLFGVQLSPSQASLGPLSPASGRVGTPGLPAQHSPALSGLRAHSSPAAWKLPLLTCRLLARERLPA